MNLLVLIYILKTLLIFSIKLTSIQWEVIRKLLKHFFQVFTFLLKVLYSSADGANIENPSSFSYIYYRISG